jgi:hypothetical protein
MNQPIIQNSYLTEIKLSSAPAANQRIKFIDVPELSQRMKGALIVGVQLFNATALTTSPNGFAVVPTLAGIVLTLTEASLESIYQFPCFDLQPANNSGFIRMFNKKKINISKSYITIFDATGIAINQAVVVNFIYETTTR